MNSFEQFYQGRKILVTGHTGFKGGWLATWLRLLGAEVTGFALPPNTSPNLFTAAAVGEGINSIFGDIRELSELRTAVIQHCPEIIIHNAAQPLVRRSYREPIETYATNVMGTAHLLEAARHVASVRAVVVVTSDKCYENREWSRGYREDDAMGGHDPYSSSKGAAELVVAAYRRSFYGQAGSACVASVRAGNVIGGGDWSEDRLIPDMVRGICSSNGCVIRRPEAVRPWQHVLEPLRGYLLLAQRMVEHGHSYAGAWNFGPRQEDAVPVAQIAKRFTALWGKGQVTFQPDPTAPHEAQYLRLDCEKAARRLGWQPKLTLDDTLEWTTEWYRGFYDDASKARLLTENQIKRYMREAEI